jgi:RNA polymerase sigma-70 factor, ECF subfamily
MAPRSGLILTRRRRAAAGWEEFSANATATQIVTTAVDARGYFALLDRGPQATSRQLAEFSLVERAQAGDETAFTALVADRQDRLFRLAWSILRDDADARDAAQETCIKAWRELPRLRDPDRFDAWLTRSLVNRCRDMLRSRKRTTVREIRMDSTPAASGFASSSDLGDDFADADAIRRAFARLKPDDRTYLALHYADGLSVAEIAATVGAPVGTVKWRLSRARDALERQLAREAR